VHQSITCQGAGGKANNSLDDGATDVASALQGGLVWVRDLLKPDAMLGAMNKREGGMNKGN